MTGGQQLGTLTAPQGAPEAVDSKLTTVLILRRRSRWLAVRIADVREVTLVGPVTPIPAATSIIQGVTLVRGRVVPVLALERLVPLGDETEVVLTLPRLLILAQTDVEIAIVADETRGLANVELPAGRGGNSCVRAEVTWNDRLLTVLDVAAVMAEVEAAARA